MMKTLDDYISAYQIPLINAIFYNDGKILVIDSYYIGKEFELRILCESTLNSFFSFNEIDDVSNFDIICKRDYMHYRIFCGEGSYGSDGIIYVTDTVKHELEWSIFLNNSNPFNKIDCDAFGDIIIFSTKGFKLIIPIEKPEKLRIEN